MFDISLRALWILKTACCIFAEDTRQSRKLLDWYGIKTRVVACHEHNETDYSIISRIKSNKIFALVSDAGTPTVSDPGYRLVNWCLKNNINVFPIPGASAMTAAMSASGMPSNRFTFAGFLPQKGKARKDFLNDLKNEVGTLIFYESPNRLVSCLHDMFEIFGDRYCCVCREITKVFEEFKHGNLSENLLYFRSHKPVGEFVILLSGHQKRRNNKENIKMEEIFAEVEDKLSKLLEKKSLRESVKILAEEYRKCKLSRREIYSIGLKLRN